MKTRAFKKSAGGFTLVEIMVVVIVISILAATIIPKFVGTTHDAKVATAKANIAELDSALERYNVQMDAYPSTEEGLAALVRRPVSGGAWNGPYLKTASLPRDPWGHDYLYRAPGQTGPYDVGSLGPEGREGGSATLNRKQ